MLKLNTVRYKNFCSTGNNFTTIDLSSNPTTLLRGRNGGGKSTVLDAVCFGLYGVPLRNIPKPLLLNSTNKKGLLVEIEFETQNNKYLIRRGLKPTVFEIYCNGTPVPALPSVIEMQDYVEKYILKCNYKAFTQVVILGATSYVPFMQLTPQARREVIEDILDIEVFSTMFSILKEKLSTTKDELLKAQSVHTVNQSQHDLANSYNDQWQKEEDARIQQLQTDYDNLENDLTTISSNLLAIETEIQKYSNLTTEIETEIKTRNELNDSLTKLSTKHEQLKSSYEFFDHNSQCPTCEQEIAAKLKTDKLTHFDNSLKELESKILEIKNSIITQDNKISKLQKKKTIYDSILNDKKIFQAQETSIKGQQAKLKAKLSKKNTPPQTTQLGDLVASKKEVDRLLNQKHVLEQGYVLLKDNGIKTRIIKQYLPIINKTINKYLTALEFPIHFILDEQFKETMKSKGRDEFIYNNFSEGERKRIDLAIILAWRDLAKLKNSVACNLLIFDEIFDSSLDTDGMDNFMLLLQKISKDTNVFIITHKDGLGDKFPNTLVVTKKKGFSSVSKA